ncbi:MAG: hypothetical protein Q9181_006111 [Wetmoreana brouardii]
MISALAVVALLAVGVVSAPAYSSDQRSVEKRQDYTIPEYVTTEPDQSTTPANGQSGSPPSSGDDSLFATINRWRSTFGANALSWSEDMVNAAANTGQLNGGTSMSLQHHNPSDAAEVIAAGSDTDMGQDLKGRSPFEISLIAWLCENPENKMGDSCDVQAGVMNIHNIDTQHPTGHHDILVDNSYTQIGCAFTKNPNADGWFGDQGLLSAVIEITKGRADLMEHR